jgi:DNA-binding GntR family transcriptional regulator
VDELKKYQYVVKKIEDLIEQKESNQMIDSERILSTKLNISRMTVRKAIDLLVREGKLYRVNHVGTFISEQKQFKVLNTMMSFSEEVVSAGGKVTNIILDFKIIKSDEFISRKLNILLYTDVYYLVRLRKKDDQALAIEESYYPIDLIKLDKDIILNSIYQYLKENYKYKMSSSIQEIKAILIEKDYAKLLEMKEFEPTILIDQVSYLDNGRIFEYIRSYKNQNHYELIVQAMNLRK